MNVTREIEEIKILKVADVESGHSISALRSAAGNYREILILPVRAISVKSLVNVTGVEVSVEDVNCGRRSEGNQLLTCLRPSDYFRQVGIGPITVVVKQLMKIVVHVAVKDVLVISHRESGDRVLVSLGRTGFSG